MLVYTLNCSQLKLLSSPFKQDIFTILFQITGVKITLKKQKRKKVKVAQSVQLFATPWTAARQASLSVALSWQEYWSG